LFVLICLPPRHFNPFADGLGFLDFPLDCFGWFDGFSLLRWLRLPGRFTLAFRLGLPLGFFLAQRFRLPESFCLTLQFSPPQRSRLPHHFCLPLPRFAPRLLNIEDEGNITPPHCRQLLKRARLHVHCQCPMAGMRDILPKLDFIGGEDFYAPVSS
jgi:hypothetical protein